MLAICEIITDISQLSQYWNCFDICENLDAVHEIIVNTCYLINSSLEFNLSD